MCMSHVIKLWVLQFVIMGNVSYLLTLNDNNANDPLVIVYKYSCNLIFLRENLNLKR